MLTAEEPGRWLQDAGNSVKRHSFYMKKALVRKKACVLHTARGQSHATESGSTQESAKPGVCLPQDEDNLREALRYSAAMLGELRTSLLTPQPYYELYMQATGELQLLEVRSWQNARYKRPCKWGAAKNMAFGDGNRPPDILYMIIYPSRKPGLARLYL